MLFLSDYRESIIRTDAREVGVVLDQKQIQLFLIYLRELKEWNQKVNLTSLKEDTSIIKNHFIDSLSIIPHLPSAISLLAKPKWLYFSSNQLLYHLWYLHLLRHL